MTPIELRKMLSMLKVLIGGGFEDYEIAKRLKLDFESLDKLKTEFYKREEARLLTEGNAKAYIDYVAEQRACIGDLNDLIEEFRTMRQTAAIVSAVKVRSDILDKIVQRGMDLGFIEKSPERIIGGVVISEMSSEELRTAILAEIGSLDKLIRMHGSSESILDVPVGPIHREIEAPKRKKTPVKKKGKRSTAKGARAKTSKIHGGRSVVKKKVVVSSED